jgi:hypothetical protein
MAAGVSVLGAAWVPLTWTPLGDAALVIAGTAIAAGGAVFVAAPWWSGSQWPPDGLLALAMAAGAVGGVGALILLDPGTASWSTAGVIGAVAAAATVLARTWLVTAVNEASVPAPAVDVSVLSAPSSSHSDQRSAPPAGEGSTGAAADAPSVPLPPGPESSQPPDVLVSANAPALVASACAAVLVAAVPVYVAARILVG